MFAGGASSPTSLAPPGGRHRRHRRRRCTALLFLFRLQHLFRPAPDRWLGPVQPGYIKPIQSAIRTAGRAHRRVGI